MINAVIFDMDGVLVDSEPLQYEAYAQVMYRYGVELTKAEFIEYWIGKGNLSEHLERHKLDVPVVEVRQRKNAVYADLVRRKMRTRPGIIGLLKRLHAEMPTALASSAHEDSVNAVLNRFSLRQYFNVILAGNDVSKNKPDPEIYLLAAKLLSVEPENCLVFEDSPSGIKAGKAAGMKVFALPHEFTAGQDLSEADLIISDLRNLRLRLNRKPSR